MIESSKSDAPSDIEALLEKTTSAKDRFETLDLLLQVKLAELRLLREPLKEIALLLEEYRQKLKNRCPTITG